MRKNPMRVLFDIGHPAHVHLFKNTIFNLKKDGHEIKITARKKEVAEALLTAYGLDYDDRGKIYSGILNKAFGMIKIDLKLFLIAKKFKPDILVGVNNPYVAHVGAVLRKPVIIFNDTENVTIARVITYPFVQVILTPMYFREHVDPKKHVKIRGMKEIAYLHPNYFSSNPHVLKELDLLPNEKFIIIRFGSWVATHDIGQHGIKDKIRFVKNLEKYGRVLLTSDGNLPEELKPYLISTPPEKFHDLLSFAALYIGEGITMASEAAVLGTPAINITSTAKGKPTCELYGNFVELREKYDLVHFFASEDDALIDAQEILKNPCSRSEWQKKRHRFLADVVDVTAWLTDFIEKYPDSFINYKKNNRVG
jgi:predicted glycosyltransferase